MPAGVTVATKDIRGRVYTFAKVAATEGLRLQIGLAKMAGAEIAMLAGLAAGKSQDIEELGEILQRVAAKADPDELLRLMEIVFKKATCEGKPIVNVDLTFGDDTLALWQAFVEGLKVNLGDFLAGSLSTGSPPASAEK